MCSTLADAHFDSFCAHVSHTARIPSSQEEHLFVCRQIPYIPLLTKKAQSNCEIGTRPLPVPLVSTAQANTDGAPRQARFVDHTARYGTTFGLPQRAVGRHRAMPRALAASPGHVSDSSRQSNGS